MAMSNLDTLRKMRIHSGELLEVETLPMLAPFYNTSVDEWAPRSYANFYIGNQCVLVPTYETPQDNIACDIIARHFPDRKIVPIDCREIVKGQGAVHCLTQQLPAIK